MFISIILAINKHKEIKELKLRNRLPNGNQFVVRF